MLVPEDTAAPGQCSVPPHDCPDSVPPDIVLCEPRLVRIVEHVISPWSRVKKYLVYTPTNIILAGLDGELDRFNRINECRKAVYQKGDFTIGVRGKETRAQLRLAFEEDGDLLVHLIKDKRNGESISNAKSAVDILADLHKEMYLTELEVECREEKGDLEGETDFRTPVKAAQAKLDSLQVLGGAATKSVKGSGVVSEREREVELVADDAVSEKSSSRATTSLPSTVPSTVTSPHSNASEARPISVTNSVRSGHISLANSVRSVRSAAQPPSTASTPAPRPLPLAPPEPQSKAETATPPKKPSRKKARKKKAFPLCDSPPPPPCPPGVPPPAVPREVPPPAPAVASPAPPVDKQAELEPVLAAIEQQKLMILEQIRRLETAAAAVEHKIEASPRRLAELSRLKQKLDDLQAILPHLHDSYGVSTKSPPYLKPLPDMESAGTSNPSTPSATMRSATTTNGPILSQAQRDRLIDLLSRRGKLSPQQYHERARELPNPTTEAIDPGVVYFEVENPDPARREKRPVYYWHVMTGAVQWGRPGPPAAVLRHSPEVIKALSGVAAGGAPLADTRTTAAPPTPDLSFAGTTLPEAPSIPPRPAPRPGGTEAVQLAKELEEALQSPEMGVHSDRLAARLYYVDRKQLYAVVARCLGVSGSAASSWMAVVNAYAEACRQANRRHSSRAPSRC